MTTKQIWQAKAKRLRCCRSLLAASVLRSVKHPTHRGMIQQIRKTNGLRFNLSNQNRMQ
ncbi:Uncharacterized protein APZ42_014564 [Daphnia magna]|uniref:Uncharacterized protein n=1 Tax=Daphnia magna TaxID=35525 RepID=A0A162PPT0_9CRUS|nr:Uncharacterized protein APZ42_014564 [Daphnia magna]